MRDRPAGREFECGDGREDRLRFLPIRHLYATSFVPKEGKVTASTARAYGKDATAFAGSEH